MMLKDLVKKFGVLLVLTMLVAVCVGAVSADGPTSNNVRLHITVDGSIDSTCAVNGTHLFYGTYKGMDWDSTKQMGIACYDYTNGEKVWFRSVGDVGSGIAVSDGKLFAGLMDGSLICLDEFTGETLWTIPGLGSGYWGLSGTPQVSGNTVYVASAAKNATLGFDISTKAEVFNYSMQRGIDFVTPTITADGKIIVPTGNSVVMLSSDAEVTKKLDLADFDTASSAVIHGDAVYLNAGGRLYSINLNTFSENWNVSTLTSTNPAVTDSAVYVSQGGNLAAYSVSGGTSYPGFTTHVSGGSSGYLHPVISDDGSTVFYAMNAAQGKLYSINATTGAENWAFTLPSSGSSNGDYTFFASSPVLKNGMLFIGSEGPGMYALGAGSLIEVDGTSQEDDPVTPPDDPEEPTDVTKLYDRTIIVFNETGTSATVKDVLDVASASGGFTYNLSEENSIADINGIANTDSKFWMTTYYNNGGTSASNVYDPVIEGATISFHYDASDSNGKPLGTEYLVNITVKDIQKPITPSEIYDGSVHVVSAEGPATVKDALNAASAKGAFTYNLTQYSTIADINGITNTDDWSETWMTTYYNNGETPVYSVADPVITGAVISLHYDVMDSTWAPLATRYVVNVTVSSITTTIYDRATIVFNETGTSATLEDALNEASASGGFTYNLTADGKLSDINGIVNNAGKTWSVESGKDAFDAVNKDEVITITYGDSTTTDYRLKITVKDIQKPIIPAVLYDGTVTLTSGTATVKDALDKAAASGRFTYNLTQYSTIADINGIANTDDWSETWMTTYYNNGETPVYSVADPVIDGAVISIHYDVMDSRWTPLATRYVVNVTVDITGRDPVVPPTPQVIDYVSINPGSGSFDYTATDGSVFTVDRMTPFGVLYASGNSVKAKAGSFGLYVYSINSYDAVDKSGWMYTVNGIAPSVGSSSYSLSNGDKVIWYYSDSMDSKPETSTPRYAFVVSLPAGTLPTQTTNTTNVTQVVLPPAEKVIPETKPIENTTGMVILEKTETVKEIQVPVEILSENKNASVKVVEGNTEEVKLPVNVTADDVHLILEVSVVNETGEKITVDKPGHFTVDVEVPKGKRMFVGHFNETSGIWENCPVEPLQNGQWKVTYYSLSPFSILFLDEGKENPFVIIEAPEEPEQTEPDTTNETKPVETPSEEAKSPLAAAWLIPGIFALGACLKRRND